MMAPVHAHLWSAEEVAAATAGRPVGDWCAHGVSIDSRTVKPGDLFIAIKGPKHDGHKFADDALTAGAAAVVVQPRRAKIAHDAPSVQVANTMHALEDLGRAGRERTAARVIAVTGSVGKTGTKEALRFVLEDQGPTVASEGSLNNHWGVPLSLARMPVDAAYAVIEIGMNHPGEITPLTNMARPHVAVITAVEAVHSAYFDSIDEIADAKGEIFWGVEESGTAVLNRDNPQYERLVGMAQGAGIANVIGFGAHKDAQVRLIEANCDAEGSDVKAAVLGEDISYRLNVGGRHWVMNSLAVLAAVGAAGGDTKKAAGALAGMRALKGRGRRHSVELPAGAFTVIDESYNASPASMAAAINVLGTIYPDRGGRRIAVLGDMLELGGESDPYHAGLVESLIRNKIDLVFACGTYMKALWEVLPHAMRGEFAKDSSELMPKVTVRAGDVVLVKGSAGSKTGSIVEALLDLGECCDAGPDERDWAVNG
jgi:UDP-N-acetylmuramoyl-tripeptide--D-alanyl-D-alanine ligase